MGTCTLTLPLHHPVRVAEEYAILDLISGGRLDLGVGRGFQPREFLGYGVEQRASLEMFDESLDVLRKAWDGSPFSHRGTSYVLPVTIPPSHSRTYRSLNPLAAEISSDVDACIPARVSKRPSSWPTLTSNDTMPSFIKAVCGLRATPSVLSPWAISG